MMNLVQRLQPPSPPPRSRDGHKGTFGRAWIVAGSHGMSGAACLAGVSALRAGAGLVTVAVPESIQAIVASYEPSYLTKGLVAESDGRLGPTALHQLQAVVPAPDAWAIGPGMGQSAGVQELLISLYESLAAPLVVDADGLNVLAGNAPFPRPPASGEQRILTPHLGEFRRLTGTGVDEIELDRVQAAARFARSSGAIVVLKGPGTVVTDGQTVYVNSTGNSGMATGGSGDVLTGVITGLLAQGMPAFDAAALGVHLHGLAGDLAAEELSRPGLIASDLPFFLAKAWQVLG